MHEQAKLQYIPLKVYRTSDRLTVAAPMPGLQPEDVLVEVTGDGRLILKGELRGVLKDVKELLIDEWSVGGYYRELPLPVSVDGSQTTVTYGNGVLVVSMPISERTCPARLTLDKVAPAHGEHVGKVDESRH